MPVPETTPTEDDIRRWGAEVREEILHGTPSPELLADAQAALDRIHQRTDEALFEVRSQTGGDIRLQFVGSLEHGNLAVAMVDGPRAIIGAFDIRETTDALRSALRVMNCDLPGAP